MHKIKYPKLILLLLTIFLAYFLFSGRDFAPLHSFLLSLGYVGIFFTGAFYSYGFTAAPATAVFLVIAKYENIYVASLIGGLGALLGDLVIFLFVRQSLNDEIGKLSKTELVKAINKEEKRLFGSFRHYITAVFAGFLIASPLPTEAGVALLASLKKVSVEKFIYIAYALHTFGIFIILYIGQAI